jgi:hypothetical protein
MHRVVGRVAIVGALVAVLLAACAGQGSARVAKHPPNDPDFAGCEHEDPVNGCKDSEQWDLFGRLTGNDCPAPLTGTPSLPHPDGGLPCWAPGAHDPSHMAGVNMTGAWDQGNIGRQDILVAYIEGGTNYSDDGIKDALDNVYLNRRELPYPQRANGRSAGRYDANGDGHFDIRDYANDARVNPRCAKGVKPFTKHEEGTQRGCSARGGHRYLNAVHIADKKTAYLSPEDLIAVFGHCRIRHGRLGACPRGGRFDNDGNGYPNDVSGWNFERNNNDPQTEDLAYGHAPGLMSLVAGEANNHYAGVGVCRNCRVVPIKQGAECLGRTDRWGESILYAADLGADAISSVVVSYAYSSFNQKAIDYAYRKGVALSLDSNDFDAMDHTDGMLWNHVMPGNSLFEDKGGPAANATQWFRARSNVTSYGTHNVLSGGEVTTSGGTPFLASLLAMTQSAALDARDRGVIPGRLTPNEIKQVLTDTAQPVIPQSQAPDVPNQWPGNPNSRTDANHHNFSTQYGYGRPDMGAATRMVMQGRIPPTADMTSPRWFAYVDPLRHRFLRVRGSLAPSRFRSGGSARYVLEWALGADPADSAFHTAAAGVVHGRKRGLIGSIDLGKVPRSFYSHAPGETLQPNGAEQYTMTIRLRVKDANGLRGEDRKSVGLRHDPSLRPGFPKYVKAEMGGGPSFVDLNGRHEQDLVFVTYDGDVHALRPNGRELRGFPVHSPPLRRIDPRNPQNYRARAYRNRGLRDVRDPLAGSAVGDLFGNGKLEIVANSLNGFVYAWDSHGRRLKGFPKHTQKRFWTLPVPTPRAATDHSRLPDRGSLLAPVLAPLEGGRRLDVLISGFDGFVYAWRPNGRRVPGWPVEVKLPKRVFARDGVDPHEYIRDPKLMYPVGVGDVLHKGRPQVFVSSYECNGKSTSTENVGGGLAGGPQGPDVAKTWMYGIWPDGGRHRGGAYLPHWPVAINTVSFCYDESIDFVGESTSPPSIGDYDGSGKLRVVTGGVTGPTYVVNGDGSIERQLDTSCPGAACAANPPYRKSGDSHTITLSGQAVLGDLTGSGRPQVVQSQVGLESILGALSVPGQALLPQVYEKAWDPASGSNLPTFPRRQDGFPFYESPIVADVGGKGARDAIEGNDNYWVHAYDPAGGEAAGFPKYTGQWIGFSGAVGDPRMNGRLDYVTGTREGYLYDWAVRGKARANDSWWHYRHDERNTGLYGLDTRRPARIGKVRVRRVHRKRVLRFTAPGDDAMLGRARRYVVRWSRHRLGRHRHGKVVKGVAKPLAGGRVQDVVLKGVPRKGRVHVSIRAVDEAGNKAALRVLSVGR